MNKKILIVSLLLFISTLEAQSTDTIKVLQKSPWGAVMRSALFPGLGQIYNQSYWKVPVIWGLLGWFGYNYTENNKNYLEYKRLYSESVVNGNENFIYKRIREFYKDQRDLFAIYFGLTYFLNIVDAYVDAQLLNFDILINERDLRLNFRFNF